MKKLASVWIVLLLAALHTNAQAPAQLLTTWAEKSPVEKVYLHFDKDNYIAGETAWFKAYLYADFYPDTMSTTLYVDLLDGSSVLLTKIVPVVEGVSKCQLELPDLISSGNYFVRAYTPTMLNHGDEFLFKKSIYISGSKEAPKVIGKGLLDVSFFPEGGNFVAGIPNTIAFKITDENGLPADKSGVVKNEAGDSVSALSYFHDGMGSFDLTPEAGKKYYVTLYNDATVKKYYLPAVTENGITLQMTSFAKSKRCIINQQLGNPALKPAYIIGQIQHHVVLNLPVNGDMNRVDLMISSKNMNSGILQLTVFNKDHIPLAERLTFIDNKEYLQAAELKADTLNFSEKGRNHLTLSFPDSVMGSFSMAITDPDYATDQLKKESIISNLLLTSDLKGYVHNPSYYFNADADSARIAVDILMMTHGWRRFKWTELAKVVAAPLRYQDPQYIKISGKIQLRDAKKALADKDLFVMVSPIEDSTNGSMQFMHTDNEGRFSLDSLVFFGKTRFFVSDVAGTKSKWLDIHQDRDSLQIYTGLSIPESRQFVLPPPAVLASISTKIANDYADIQKAKGEMLQEVVLKVKKKTPVQELEERYSTGQFTGGANKTIDLTNTTEKIFQNNIFDYIQGRVAGVSVQKNGPDYTVIYRSQMGVGQGSIPMVIYLDEMEVDARVVASIPATQIAMIKVFSSMLNGNSNGRGGALAIYTKKGNDLTNSLATAGDVFQYKGYSVIKEFYAPDYSKSAEAARRDQRITLEWLPDINIFGINPKFPVIFYNNERSKRFKVVVEGMTTEGKMLFMEKTFAPKGF